MNTDITTTIAQLARQHPDWAAVHVPRPRRGAATTLTFAELDVLVNRTAAALARAGLRPGMRAALMVPPGRELCVLGYALLRAGVVPVVIDPGLPRRALVTCLDEVAPEAFIGIPLAQVARVLLGWGRRSARVVITVGPRRLWWGTTLDGLRAAADEPWRPVTGNPDDLAAIAFTSGSTGVPKGVPLRRRHLAAQLELVRAAGDLPAGQVGLSTFPPFALAGPALGLATVIPDMNPRRPARANPAMLVATIERYGAAVLFAAPALLDALSRYCVARNIVLSPIRAVITAGAPLPPAVLDRTRRCLPREAMLYSGYGATECLPVSVAESRELAETRAATEGGAGTCVGRPLPANLVRVIGITDQPIPQWTDELLVPAGTIGEITVTGPSTTETYDARPDDTALAKIRDGARVVHRMGDVGWFDEQGRLWFCGRKSERIRTGAGELYTDQVEPIFNTVAGVRRSALVGVGPAGWQIPVVCVETERGVRRADRIRILAEIRGLAERHPHTAGIREVLFHRRFPVDVRHNTKIRRGVLASWATRRLPRR